MKISKFSLKQMVDEVVKEEVFKTTDLEGPYTVHVKKGRLAGQTVMANRHKVTGVYYYLNPETGTDEPLGTENDLDVQKQQDEGVGYVYAKDRAKDPKSIPGEHWRVKFQSSSDLKKHGDTEKSKIEEALFSSKEEEKKKEDKAKRAAAEIFIKFNHWDFVNALKQASNNIQRAAGLMALWGVTGTKTRPIHQTMSILFSSENRRIYTYLYMLCKQEIQEIIDLNRKTMQKESVSKRDIKSVIRELVDEMWADVGNISGDNDETLPGDDTQFGGEKKLKPTGRITEPGADEDLVNLYKGNGGQSDTSALPSVGGAMSEIQDLMEGKKNMNNKAKFLKNIIRETIEEVRDEERIKEPQEQKNMRMMLRIQSYAHWGYKHYKTHPNEVAGMFKKIADEIDGLVKAHEKGKEVSPSNINEVSPPGFSGTVKSMKKHKDITNPFALAWWQKNKGYKSHKKSDKK